MVAVKRFVYKLIKRDAYVVATECYPAANYAIQIYQSVHLVAALCSTAGDFERAYSSLTVCISQTPVISDGVAVASLAAPVSYCKLQWPSAATTSSAIATTATSSVASPASPASSAVVVATTSTASAASVTAPTSTIASAPQATSTTTTRPSTSSAAAVIQTSPISSTSGNYLASVATSASVAFSASTVASVSSGISSATQSALGASSSASPRSTSSAPITLTTSSSQLIPFTEGTAYATNTSPSPTSTAADRNGLSIGTVIGIAVGATIAVILAIGIVIFFSWRHYRKSKGRKQAAVSRVTRSEVTPEKPQLHSDDFQPHRKELEGSVVPLPLVNKARSSVDVHEVETRDLSRIRSEMSANEAAAVELGTSSGNYRSSRMIESLNGPESDTRSAGGGGAGDG